MNPGIPPSHPRLLSQCNTLALSDFCFGGAQYSGEHCSAQSAGVRMGQRLAQSSTRPQSRAARLDDRGSGEASSNPHPSRNSPSNGLEPPKEEEIILAIAEGPEGPHPRQGWAFWPGGKGVGG